MADTFRIYRRIYHIAVDQGGSTAYMLIDPTSIGAMVHNRTSGTIVESPASVVRESVGNYFADLTPTLYNGPDIFEVEWNIQYIPSSPIKNLYTQFVIDLSVGTGSTTGNTICKGAGLVVKELDIELFNSPALDYELSPHSLDYLIKPTG